MLKMYLIFEVLRLVSAVFFRNSQCCKATDKSLLYLHVLFIKEKQLRESFSSYWPIIAKSLVHQVVSEHISNHINYSISKVSIKSR